MHDQNEVRHDDFSAVVKGTINSYASNMVLDTGASASIIDLGTVQRLQLESLVKRNGGNPVNCFDASGNKMNIIGSILLSVGLIGCNDKIDHNFLVLDIQSNRSLLLGRDAMKKFKSVTFDFETKKIKIGSPGCNWLPIRTNRLYGSVMKLRLHPEQKVLLY